MKCLSSAKRLAVAVVAAAALTGPVTAAHALQFNTGDAVLVLYGNATEYVQNLGNFATLLSTGIDLDLSTIVNSNSPTGAGPASTPIKYELLGFTGNAPTDSIFFGDGTNLSTWTTPNKTQLIAGTLQTGLSNWQSLLASASDARSLIPATDSLSFSTNIDIAGTGTLGGAVPSVRLAFSNIDSLLYLLQRQVNGAGSTLAQVGTASLSSQTGHFVIASPVPVPAAAVLFATGVIGLVGVARRRMLGVQ